jgi:hypothetical protein
VTAHEGLVLGLPMADYLADDGLSGSGARKLLPPNAPAIFRWHRDHPQEPSEAMDFGSAVHQLALGDPEDRLLIVDAATWRGKEAASAKAEARAQGLIPVLARSMKDIRATAEAVRSHPLASRLFSDGQPEASLFWTDPATGVRCKCRLDWLPDNRTGRVILTDLKTSRSADPQTWAKSAADYTYHQQAANNLDGVRALGITKHAAFRFVVVETRPPYLLSVVELDDEALALGAALNHQARLIYKQCTDSGEWPGYAETVETVSLPGYYMSRHDDVFEMEIAS